MKKLILGLLVLFGGCVTHTTPPVVKPTVVVPTRNLAADFEKMMEKYGVLPKSTCTEWEVIPSSQSVICEVNSQIAVYCVAPSGQMPTCKLVIDTRPQPQPETKTPAPTPAPPQPPANPPKATSPKH